MIDERAVSRYGTLPPDKPCRFTFALTEGDKDYIVMTWFTDDAGFRWQLDEHQHLVQVNDGDERKYMP